MQKFHLTPKQEKEIKCVEYFIPKTYDGFGVCDEYCTSVIVNGMKLPMFYGPKSTFAILDPLGKSPDECYFDYSSKGIRVHFVTELKRLFQLIEGNRWRNIHIFEMYEPCILEGTWTYSDLITMPDYVVDYIKKQIFKGKDKETIECLSSI